jgi:hypothetical protein
MATTVFDKVVASPYYMDGRNVPQYAHLTTADPDVSVADAGAAITTAGPAAIVDFDLSGFWALGDTLNIDINITGNPNYSESLSAPAGMTSEDMASYVAGQLSKNPNMAAAAVGNSVTIFQVGGVALTISVLTVTLA